MSRRTLLSILVLAAVWAASLYLVADMAQTTLSGKPPTERATSFAR